MRMTRRGEDNASPVTVALVGAGNRGADVYGAYLLRFPGQARVVAVAEEDAGRRARLGAAHDISPENQFRDWDALLAQGRLADALIVATPDRLHVAPTLRGLGLGYAVLLEKPVAPTLDEVLALRDASRRLKGDVTVAHVLRHDAFFASVKRLLTEGRVGKVVSVQHTENIGYWHFAHSYVRGNWRREADSSPMILAKACHDLDIVRWLVDKPCLRVSSYGSLGHFREENAPPGSADRCTNGCEVERVCPYSAARIYLERFGARAGWPNAVLTPVPTHERVLHALETGPYGRCVYRCDNDVADHQVVACEFAEGVTATLTVSAFTEENTRTLHIMGTHGELHGHMGAGEIRLNDFIHHTRELIQVPPGQGHADADAALVRDFVTRLRRVKTGNAAEGTLTNLETSLESHLMAFAAERSRHGRESVALASLYAQT